MDGDEYHRSKESTMGITRADLIRKAGLVAVGAAVAGAVAPSVAEADGNEGPTTFTGSVDGTAPVVTVAQNSPSGTQAVLVQSLRGGTAIRATVSGNAAETQGSVGILGSAETGVTGRGSPVSNVGKGGAFRGAIGIEVKTDTGSHVRLIPGPSNKLPRVGGIGDLYCDKSGRLWFYGGQVRSGRKGWKRLA
jgi:hypothetical protein